MASLFLSAWRINAIIDNISSSFHRHSTHRMLFPVSSGGHVPAWCRPNWADFYPIDGAFVPRPTVASGRFRKDDVQNGSRGNGFRRFRYTWWRLQMAPEQIVPTIRTANLVVLFIDMSAFILGYSWFLRFYFRQYIVVVLATSLCWHSGF